MNRKIEYASFEVTSYCNLNCSFCNREEVIKHPKHISVESWIYILEKFKSHPIKEAKLQGLGEPFMHPNFSELCKIFKQYFPDSKIITATNCQYKITDNFTSALKYLDLIYLSIDGYKDNYEKFRKPSKWIKLIDFLERLIKIKKYDCKITCNYVVNKDNIKDIEKIEELCKKYQIEELRLNIAQNWSEESSLKGNISTWGYSEIDLNYLKSKYKNLIKGKAPWTWSDCFWVDKGMYVTAEGNINVCAINTSPKPLGNVFKDNIDEVLNCERMSEISRACKNNNPTNHCINCSYKELSPLLDKLIN